MFSISPSPYSHLLFMAISSKPLLSSLSAPPTVLPLFTWFISVFWISPAGKKFSLLFDNLLCFTLLSYKPGNLILVRQFRFCCLDFELWICTLQDSVDDNRGHGKFVSVEKILTEQQVFGMSCLWFVHVWMFVFSYLCFLFEFWPCLINIAENGYSMNITMKIEWFC